MDHLPAPLCLALAGRSDPPLPLARLRARGQLVELRAADLRFTPGEAGDLLATTAGSDLPAAVMAALAERTEGWAAGLHLAALSTRGHTDVSGFVAAFSGSHRRVLDYLTEEALDRQPPELITFLLESSVLDVLSGPLCDAVLGRTDSQQLLETVERANLFLLPLDGERRWWRYHHLFADLLRARLPRTDPDRALALHRASAGWHERHGRPDDAVRHALAGGDAEDAARIVEEHLGEQGEHAGREAHADGAGSQVRQRLLPHARRIDIPAIGVGGKLPLTAQTEAWLPAALTTTKNMILPRRGFLFTAVFRRRETPVQLASTVGPRLPAGVDADRLLGQSIDNDYVMLAFVAHRRDYPADVANLRGAALRAVIDRRTAHWHPDLHRLVAESDPDSVEQFDFGAAARVRPWPTIDVTLLGDAIHHMPPVGGMGGNTALSDAAQLCRTLTAVHRGDTTLPAALGDYEAEMLTRGFATVRGVRTYTRLAISRSRTLRALARSFFRLCGAIDPLRHAVFGG